ncbi:MAG TPA: septal ring lytic transglycosylase RlpA family protein [Nitrososphaera sp.]|nr:septal ring lytic transglycosylase RlpA family protein [Nitrososphaera sp.]
MGMLIRRFASWAVVVIAGFTLCLCNTSVAFSEDKAEQRAETVAEKVEQKAKQTEKMEGKNDLVKDEVKVKTDTTGKPVVEQVGEASWYGKGFQGKKTASGETFNQHELTAAHPTLPLGTEANVTNLETGKSVEVEINDRGPYTKGRDIDLSKEAAKEIGLKKGGATPVKIEAKVPPEGGKKDTR